MAEVRALNTLGSITDECNEASDSLFSQITNAVAALDASRKVGKELRVLFNNCDSISRLKDLQINLRLKQYNSEKEVSSYYRNKGRALAIAGMLSMAANVGLIYLHLKK